MKRRQQSHITERMLNEWVNASKSNRLLSKIRLNREAAKIFFGEDPIQRGDLEELTLIVNARKIVRMRNRQIAQEIKDVDFVLDWVLRSGVYAEECKRYGGGMVSFSVSAECLPLPAKRDASLPVSIQFEPNTNFDPSPFQTIDTAKLIRTCARAVIARAMKK